MTGDSGELWNDLKSRLPLDTQMVDSVHKSDVSSTSTNKSKSIDFTSSPKEKDDSSYEPLPWYRLWMYDFVLWMLTVIIDCFFREIRPRGAFRLPRTEPVIFVAAPHANQFVDPYILMNQVKRESKRRILFLIAEKSAKQRVIGLLSKFQLSIPVVRAQDTLAPATGKIYVDLDKDKLLVKGRNTKFTTECMVRGMIALPKSLGATEITEIISDVELRIKKEFKDTDNIRKLLTQGTSFKKADKIDQKSVFKRVFKHLSAGNCLGIFPEGGSHDRPDLLPLKAGVAIMALGAMSYDPNANVKIVPCGMNYFNAHKFRSRAVIEFGKPLDIPKALVAKYNRPESQREAVKELLEMITTGLKAVTVTCEDYETLMVIQAARRLYARNLAHSLPLPLIVEMNRRLVLGYQTYKNEPRVQEIKEKILVYNKKLKQLYLPDHSVEDCDETHKVRLVPVLIYRVVKITILMLLALPGATLFSPVFLSAKIISKKKATAALANSVVKIKANDVVATWKILIGMGIAPLVYSFYATLGTWYCFRYSSLYFGTRIVTNFLALYMLGVLVTYAALITGEQGLDIFKSLRPLYLSITSGSSIKELKEFRRELATEITDLVNTYGPQLFVDDFNLLEMKDTLNISDNTHYENSDDEEEAKTRELKARRANRRKIERKAARQKTDEAETDKKESDNSSFNGKQQPQEQLTSESADNLELQEGSSSSLSDTFSGLNSENSFINIPMFSDYHLHKNINENMSPLSASTSSTSISDDYNFNKASPVISRRSSNSHLELNFTSGSSTSVGDKIRSKLMENRKRNH